MSIGTNIYSEQIYIRKEFWKYDGFLGDDSDYLR